jgi:hypothetical protein
MSVLKRDRRQLKGAKVPINGSWGGTYRIKSMRWKERWGIGGREDVIEEWENREKGQIGV